MADLLIELVVSCRVRVNKIVDQRRKFEPQKLEHPSKSRWEGGEISMVKGVKRRREGLIFFVVALVEEVFWQNFAQGGLGLHHQGLVAVFTQELVIFSLGYRPLVGFVILEAKSGGG
jgi:hypothetical protein